MFRTFLAATAAALAIAIGLVWLAPRAAIAGECGGQLVRASYYGAESGNRTASGLRFDGTQLIVAHKSLPFGTRLRLTYRGRSIVVPVEDRGPYIRGRTLDLSKAVAKRLGTIGAGVVTLCMERL